MSIAIGKPFKVIRGYIFVRIFKKDKEFLKYNTWFFEASWKEAEIKNFEDKNSFLVWSNGIWKGGIWKEGLWEDGIWEGGIWEDGSIWDPKSQTYIESIVDNPNECEWSLSYGKS